MKIRQHWGRRHQLFSQSTNLSLLPRLLDTFSTTSRPVALCNDFSSVPVSSQDRQTPASETALALENTHSALIKPILLSCK